MSRQILKVKTNFIDGNEIGDEWNVHYILVELEDYELLDGEAKYALIEADDRGNGPYICSGHNRHKMISLTMRLGEFVEWEESVFNKEDLL